MRSISTDFIACFVVAVVGAVSMIGLAMLLRTLHVQCCECCVDLQHLAQSVCSICADVVACFVVAVGGASCLALKCCCCEHPISSFVSVVLTFNASLRAVAPSTLISLSALVVDFDYASMFGFAMVLKTHEVEFCKRCVDFNASLSALAPSSLIPLSALPLL